MGTNFYWMDVNKKEVHIGKRSAAGYYCWGCGMTLCKGGEEDVHTDRSDWWDHCPNCNAKPKKESMEQSAAGRELGFNKSAPAKKTGVRSCCSFNWATDPTKFFLSVPGTITDEYGRKYSVKQFKQVLEECPIRYYGSIGVDFS